MKLRKLILMICLCCSFSAFAQDDVLEKLSDMDGVSAVYISKSMFGSMGGMDMGGLDISKVAGKIEAMQVLTAEKNKAAQAMKAEADKLVKNKDYEIMMKVKDSDSKVAFYIKRENNKIKGLLMLVDETPKEYTIIQIKGDLSLKEIQNITNQK